MFVYTNIAYIILSFLYQRKVLKL